MPKIIVKETPLNSKESRRELTGQKLLDIKERLAIHGLKNRCHCIFFFFTASINGYHIPDSGINII